MAEELTLKATITGDTAGLQAANKEATESLVKVGTAAKATEAEVDKLEDAEKDLAIATELAAKALKKNSEDLKAFGDLTSKFGSTLTGFVTLPLVAIGAASIKSASDMEQFKLSFEVLLGSTEKSTALLSQLREFASATPFELKDLAQGAKTLLSFGVELENIMPITKQIGDIALGNSEKFNSLSLVFGQISSTGKLMGQDLLQLINAGFNPLQEISRKTGESMEELKERMSDGKITFAEVSKAFESATSAGGRFYGGMEKLGQSFEGMVSTLKDDAAALGQSFGELILPALKNTVAGLSDTLQQFNKLSPETKEFIGTIAMVAAAIGPVVFVTGKAISAFASLGTTINIVKAGMTAFSAATNIALGPLGLVIAGIAVLGIGINGISNGIKDYNESFEKNIKLAKDHSIEAEQTIGKVDALTKSNKLSAEQVDKLIVLYPQLNGQLTAGVTTLGQAEEATKKLAEQEIRLANSMAMRHAVAEKAEVSKYLKDENDQYQKSVEFIGSMTEAYKKRNQIQVGAVQLEITVYEEKKKRESELNDQIVKYYAAANGLVLNYTNNKKKSAEEIAAEERLLAEQAIKRVKSLTDEEKKAFKEKEKLERENLEKLQERQDEAYRYAIEASQVEADRITKIEEERVQKLAKSLEDEKSLWSSTMADVTQIVSGSVGSMNGLMTTSISFVTRIKDAAKDGIKDVRKFVGDMAKDVAGLVTSIFGMVDKATQQSTQRQQAAIDKQIQALQKENAVAQSIADKKLANDLKALDKETAAKKKAAGIEEKTQVEKDKEILASAKATGDAVAIKEAEDQLIKDMIDQEAAAKKLELESASAQATEERAKREASAEETLQKKKSDLAYKAAHAAWELSLIQAAIGAAMAIIQCYSSMEPVSATIAAVLVGAVTGIEIGIMASNEPTPSSFAVGTNFSPAGTANLAEQGPELVIGPSVHNLAKGSTVLTAQQTADVMGRKGTTMNFNIGTASRETVGAIAQAINVQARRLAFQGVI